MELIPRAIIKAYAVILKASQMGMKIRRRWL